MYYESVIGVAVEYDLPVGSEFRKRKDVGDGTFVEVKFSHTGQTSN